MIMLGEILTLRGLKSKVAGMLPATILFVLVRVLELSADETPDNTLKKVTQHTKEMNTAKAVSVLIGILLA